MHNHAMIQPGIKAIGTAVPRNKISQEEHYSILESANGMTREQKLVLRNIYSKSGIDYRHSVLNEFGAADHEENLLFHPSGNYKETPVSGRMSLYEQYAPGLCAEAAIDCFNQLPLLKKEEITHIITFSCTGMYAPGLDIQLVEQLGLNRNAERTCINFMGCYAAINALKTAYHICRSEKEAVVMIAGVELCSLHYQRSYEAGQMVANALFGDGAAAAVISSKDIKNAVTGLSLQLECFYAEFEKSAGNDMVWRIGNEGFDLQLSAEVPNILRQNIQALTEKLFQKAGLSQAAIDYFAIHPGGTKILEACEQSLQLSKEQNTHSYSVLREYGNMSSVTVLFVLSKYLRELTEVDKGKIILSCAFGPGITMESMIAKIA
jgi:predicted naringenin-chalcone synthase